MHLIGTVTSLALTMLSYKSVLSYGLTISPEMETFQHQLKGWEITGNVETTLFESQNNRSGLLTHQWSGGDTWYHENTIIKIYIDYETSASIQYSLLLGHGMGFGLCKYEGPNVKPKTHARIGPFNSKFITHEANEGGLANFYNIPFTKHIKITATVPKSGILWYIVRGMYNTPLIFSSFKWKLPNNTRLYLYRTENQELSSLQKITLAKINNSSGALFQVTLQQQSSNWLPLEACFRANIDGKLYNLSSGTEDFFGSSMYFDDGTYAADQYGATWIDKDTFSTSTYRFFTQDPIIFHHNFELIWKDGENQYCNEQLAAIGDIPNVQITAYVWVYQFQTQASNNGAMFPEFQGTYETPQSVPANCMTV